MILITFSSCHPTATFSLGCRAYKYQPIQHQKNFTNKIPKDQHYYFLEGYHTSTCAVSAKRGVHTEGVRTTGAFDPFYNHSWFKKKIQQALSPFW